MKRALRYLTVDPAVVALALLALSVGCGAGRSQSPETIPPPCMEAAHPVCNGTCPIDYVCATDSDWPDRCTCIVDWTMPPR